MKLYLLKHIGLSFVLTLAFSLLVNHAEAQILIKGQITKNNTTPINDATIHLKNLNNTYKGSTDSLGNFKIDIGSTGKYVLTIQAEGYTTFTKTYTINQPNSFNLGVLILEPHEENLQTVEIVGTKSKKYYSNYSFSANKIATLNKDIPQAISTVSKELITDRQAFTLSEALKNTSGVTPISYYNQFSIRGISQNEEGTIINGMRTRQHYFNQPLTNNIERIEIIKGPASATLSSVDPGGSINLVTKKPLAEERKEISIATGSFSSITGTLDFTGPLNKDKSLLYRLNVGHRDARSFRDLQFYKDILISPSFSYVPNDKTNINVELIYNNSNNRLDRGQAIFGAVAGKTDLHSTPINFSIGAPNDYFKSKELVLMSSFSHAFTKKISLNISYMKQTWSENLLEHRTTNSFAVDVNNKPIPTLAAMQVVQRQQFWNTDNLSAYFNINGKTGPLSHKLVVGYDFINTIKYLGGGQNAARGYLLADGKSTANYDPNKQSLYQLTSYNGVLAPKPNVEHFDLQNPNYTLRNTSDYIFSKSSLQPGLYQVNGIYLQDQINYDKLTLNIGLRQEWFEDISNYKTNNKISVAQHKFLPRLGLMYAINENINVYTTYLQGYQPQSNTANLVPVPPPVGTNFPALTSDLKEVGLKSEWFSKRILFNLSVYEINQKNLLMSANDPNNPDLLTTRGAERSRGLDLDLSGSIQSNWQFNFTYSYINATITNDKNPLLIGARKQNTPIHSGSLWTRYNIEQLQKIKGLGFGLGIQYSGDKIPWYTRDFILPAYTLVDAAIYYQPNKSKLQLALNVNNIFNSTYWLGAQNYLRLFPGTPRNMMLNATYKF
ncbi:TonB-dependent siderophore receptor [Pedobacter sp. Hv1]|uniref:TonB-dependent siderophore receptor n=1 Tax=Pedobacter sp. Hv1 TaxID=1740090 RepID=UPI0006D8D168|nr:TonB-dependent siderophore receptor [Pedobacter sp. Hv1]KQC02242.1 ferrichrome-iron receptor [Pedobacter sp. Hv1]